MRDLSNTTIPKASHMKLVSSLDLHRTRSMRERGKINTHPLKAAQSTVSLPLTRLIRRTCTQPYANLKKMKITNELVMEGKKAAKERKSKNMRPMIKITARRTKQKKARKTKKILDIVAFAQEVKRQNQIKAVESNQEQQQQGTTAKRKCRKRPHSQMDMAQSKETNVNAEIAPPLRKSARLLKDNIKAEQREADKRRINCFSPPMTRLRLRRLMQCTQDITTQTTDSITKVTSAIH